MSDEKQAELTSEINPENLTDEAVDDATEDSLAATEEIGEEAKLITQLREELAAAQSKADDYLDKLQRTAADFQNSRRRLENQLSEEVERANGALIKRIVPVLDDLDLAFQNVPSDLQTTDGNEGAALQNAWVQGFRQIRKKLFDLLADQGVSTVDTSGEFDPNQHEAISSEPSETVPSGHIIAEVRAGYLYKGRVLRPALVRVAM
jgi:molecular chaperone GrpE